jgi:excisionase family DNA binding protein
LDRLTVQEAADRLGVKEDAIRKRIQRGSLIHEKEDGRVYVYLDVTQDTAHDASYPQAQVEGNGELVEELRDRVRYLERQLDQEREARTEERRRHDTLLAQLMTRIPELEAPLERRDGPEVVSEDSGWVDAPADNGGPQEATDRRSWWRQFFGLG